MSSSGASRSSDTAVEFTLATSSGKSPSLKALASIFAFLFDSFCLGGYETTAGMDLVCMSEGNKAVFWSSVMSSGAGTRMS